MPSREVNSILRRIASDGTTSREADLQEIVDTILRNNADFNRVDAFDHAESLLQKAESDNEFVLAGTHTVEDDPSGGYRLVNVSGQGVDRSFDSIEEVLAALRSGSITRQDAIRIVRRFTEESNPTKIVDDEIARQNREGQIPTFIDQSGVFKALSEGTITRHAAIEALATINAGLLDDEGINESWASRMERLEAARGMARKNIDEEIARLASVRDTGKRSDGTSKSEGQVFTSPEQVLSALTQGTVNRTEAIEHIRGLNLDALDPNISDAEQTALEIAVTRVDEEIQSIILVRIEGIEDEQGARNAAIGEALGFGIEGGSQASQDIENAVVAMFAARAGRGADADGDGSNVVTRTEDEEADRRARILEFTETREGRRDLFSNALDAQPGLGPLQRDIAARRFNPIDALFQLGNARGFSGLTDEQIRSEDPLGANQGLGTFADTLSSIFGAGGTGARRPSRDDFSSVLNALRGVFSIGSEDRSLGQETAVGLLQGNSGFGAQNPQGVLTEALVSGLPSIVQNALRGVIDRRIGASLNEDPTNQDRLFELFFSGELL
jgi:hypothetical protein